MAFFWFVFWELIHAVSSFICKVVCMAIPRVSIIDLFLTDRTLWNNNEVDYGNAICSSSLEARISLHWNLHHGYQSADSKILQPCGTLNSLPTNKWHVFLCSLMLCLYGTKSQAFQKFSRIDNYLAKHHLILLLITNIVRVKFSSMCPTIFDLKFEYCSKCASEALFIQPK